MRIGIFDSGVGGLTVLKEVKNRYPNNDYIYVADNKNVPYGSKTKEQLLELSSKIMDFLLTKNIDLCIVACGTISSNVLNELKGKYSIKIIDIISPTIKYINENKYKKICVFATEATINSHIFKNSLNIEVIERKCPLLVPLIESGNINSIDMKNAIRNYLKDIDCNTIVLGCTHYPLIKHLIDRNTINMGENIILDSNSGNGTCEYYFNKIDDNLLNNVKMIIGNVCIRKW